MNANSQFSALPANLQPVLDALEEQRQANHQKCQNSLKWCLGAGLIGIGIGLAVTATNGFSPLWAAAPLALALAVYAVIYNGAAGDYGSSFKAQVMPNLVAQFGALSFRGEVGLDESEFIAAGLFERPDRFSSEDLIEGSIGQTRLRFSEVHAESRETRTDSKGHTTTHYETIFRGLLFIADFNKNFAGTTYILPDGLTASLGNFGAGLQALGGKMSGRGELVRLEDPEFEAQFQVFSSDQIEARYLLSSSLMRRFLALRSQFGVPISAVLQRESLYLCIETGANWFEPPALSTPLSLDSLGEVLRQLQSATGVVETLDLNTRIWTKK